MAEAERTGCGIAGEKLTGIRDRVRFRKPQRATLHSWAFAQLGSFLAYKAKQAGVAFVEIDPAIRRRRAAPAGGSINEIAAVKRYSSVAGVGSLGTPTTMQR